MHQQRLERWSRAEEPCCCKRREPGRWEVVVLAHSGGRRRSGANHLLYIQIRDRWQGRSTQQEEIAVAFYAAESGCTDQLI